MTASMPMVLLAPGRFSTTTGCPHFCRSFSAVMRAMVSTLPPGGTGRMNLIGLDG
jgi:hypothetical protein